MSVSPLVTEGFGSFGSVAFVVTLGFGTSGVAPVGPSSDGGGPSRRGGKKHLSYLTAKEKKRVDEIAAKLEAELKKLPAEPAKTPEQQAIVATVEQRIEEYKTQIASLDPTLGAMVQAYIEITAHHRREKIAKARKSERNKKALLMLLNG